MKARIWHPDGSAGPGCLREVDLPVLEVQESGLVLPNLRVLDVRGGVLFEGPELCFEHACGGGPLASREAARQARAFGVVNVAYHLRRGMDYLTLLLGHPLPSLTAKIGMHADQRPTWGGAHYRLPAVRYHDLAELEPVAPTGEIHFGPGRRFVAHGQGRYFHAPAHNAAIIYHELGHHLCRHTADFRLNRRRPLKAQLNRKVPLDEGTSDYVAAVLLGTPDIFGWHRAGYPRTSQQRRCLDGSWTMSSFWGQGSAYRRWGEGTDPHIDGTVWSAALWATRMAFVEDGVPGELFDRLVVQALVRLGPAERDMPRLETLGTRRRFSRFLQALVDADHACGTGCSALILRTFAQRGILPGYSNEELRDRARQELVGAAV